MLQEKERKGRGTDCLLLRAPTGQDSKGLPPFQLHLIPFQKLLPASKPFAVPQGHPGTWAP